MPAAVKILPRQIEPADIRVLVDIAQDIGQLQRASEMMRQLDPGVVRHAEDPHRQTADRARDPVAIQIERCEVGRADVGHDIHFHAVDDGEEILAPEAEIADRPQKAAHPFGWLAGIEQRDIVAIAVQFGKSGVARPVGIGDVIDLAAELVDLEHGLAFGARQNPHRQIERRAAGMLRGIGRDGWCCHGRRSCARRNEAPPGRSRRATVFVIEPAMTANSVARLR